ncbi:MAG: hypothetical protein ABW184_08410 [Sphingobium sp.]
MAAQHISQDVATQSIAQARASCLVAGEKFIETAEEAKQPALRQEILTDCGFAVESK